MKPWRFMRILCVMIAGAGLKAAGAKAEIVDWRPSQSEPGAIRVRLNVAAKSIELDLRVIKASSLAKGSTLLIEAGKSDALLSLATLRNIMVAKFDLSRLTEETRGPALRDLIGKLKKDSAATRILAHSDPQTSPALIADAALFDGLLLENALPPASPKAPRAIILFGADGVAKITSAIAAGASESANQRRFYLPATSLSPTSTDSSCKASINRASADPARRALLVALDAWTRGATPPASRFPGVGDLVPARMLKWPKIPNLPAPPADDRLAIKIDVDGNETAGLRMPDRALPVATFVNFTATRDTSANHCHGEMVFPFAAAAAARAGNDDPRLSLIERYGSRAYYVATLRVVADRLVRERLLLPQDADACVAAGKAAPF